ncbi:hypothetical protein BDP27DRAFT_1421121 [Rhodocollybia butyracea]|uniref:Antifreeze protein n=1 Tax=Rhodocollybia butyracea TaxID=206335 RepID=A0A9P5PWJ3_9AGAR|nr:hypothetical protein BDP27DRAFT_1421121 [Rhodocollybia butyracea]
MLSNVNKVVWLSLLASFLRINAAPAVVSRRPTTINLGTVSNYAILAETGVTTGPLSLGSITGNVPIADNELIGFAMALASKEESATLTQVTDDLFAASSALPTPGTMTTAVSNMQAAYTAPNGLINPGIFNLANGAIGRRLLLPALYKWTSSVTIDAPGVTISGTAADVFVFQIVGALTVAAGAKVTLLGGVLASNIFWVVTGAMTVDAEAHFEGIILA